MKRGGEPNKFYYDITIDHDPYKNELRYGIASKAETTIELLDPLIENPEEYSLMVSKFKIDTETIPIMIPELVQPQLLSDLNNSKFRTTFKVRVNYNITLPDGKTKRDVNSTQYVYIPFHKTGYSPVGMGDMFDITYDKDDKTKISDAKIYVNNVDEQCFVYDYYTLIKAINDAIQELYTLILASKQ